MDKQAEFENKQAEERSSDNNQPLLDSLLKQNIQPPSENRTKRYAYSLIGLLSSLDDAGCPVVAFSMEGRQFNFKANTTVKLGLEHMGQPCLLVFNQGNLEEPIITGLIQQPTPIDTAVRDDRPIVIHSETGIVLKCGSSRIELTEDGTINIQGMHINNQAYGPNRIKGGSVKIN